jgi:uncharacterized protein (TIGR02391 family)
MTIKLLEGLRKLQEVLTDLGFGGSFLALPAPRTSGQLALPAPFKASGSYADVIDDQDILDASRDLFGSAHYSIAVQEAFKAVDNFVADRVGEKSMSGMKLMRDVFSKDNPRLFWSNRTTQSEKDQHEGYQHIFAGAMQGIRNPVVHDFNWVDDPTEALELIVLAQHLIKKAKIAQSGAATPPAKAFAGVRT